MKCSPPGSSVHGISQARIMEPVTISSSRGSFRHRDRKPTCPAFAGGFFTTEPPGMPRCIFSSVQSLSRVRLLATPWTAALQASLSTTSSQSSLRLLSVESVVPPNHLILCLDEQNRFQIMMDPCHLDKALGLQMEKRTSPPRIPQTPGAHPWARLAWKGEQRDAAGWIPQASHSKRVLLSESEQLLLKS